MDKIGIIQLLNRIRTNENSDDIDKAIEKVNTLQEENIEKICDGKTEEEIMQILNTRLTNVMRDRIEEPKVKLNDMFSYGRTSDTVHIHLVPKDLRPMKQKLGDQQFNIHIKRKLEDALSSLQDIFKKDTNIEEVFAVSPIFYHSDWKEMFEDLGFDKLEECTEEKGMKKFIDMFNKDNEKTRKVFYTRIQREKFLGTEYRKDDSDIEFE